MKKNLNNISVVLLAGGSGTRLWPISRASHPKQYLQLAGDETLLKSAIKTSTKLNPDQMNIMCHQEHRFRVAEQVKEINPRPKIFLEPESKNTCATIAISCLAVDPETIIVAMPADHVYGNEEALLKSLNNAIELARKDLLITLGITPSEAHTGYGYIKQGEQIDNGFHIDKFVEKPDLKTAEKLLKEGGYFWNSGIFVFRAGTFLDELSKFRKDIFDSCTEIIESKFEDLDFIRFDSKVFSKCPNDSIDYAVMEQTSKAAMISLHSDWSDIGSFKSLWSIGEKDDFNNVSIGDVINIDSKNCYTNTNNQLVSLLGVDNLVVVSTPDVVLVADMQKSEEIKSVVEKLKDNDRDEWKWPRKVFRPWGTYESIALGSRYQVKLITVNSGEKLSIQKHFHRSEHWVIVSGTAKVTLGDKEHTVYEGNSIYVPIGEIHSLENPGKFTLELIEVQSGSYLGEDDIVRLEDKYGRS